MRSTARFLAILTLITWTACGGDSSGDDDDDDVVDTDADPNAPDADPNAPDADPNAPDAATSCSDGLMLCGGKCADLLSDDDHCGACDDPCGAGETCVLGDCAAGVGALVISELHAQQPAYFELYNGGSSAIDLAGHQVQWDTDGIASGSLVLPAYSLGPDEFVVLMEGAGPAGDGVLMLGDTVAWSSHAAIRLLAPGGLGLDFVRTGGSVVAPPTGTTWTGANAANPGGVVDQSLVRNVYAPDTNAAGDWKLTSPGSPGAFCARPGRCGDACRDFASDHDNCGGCGATCGATQICLDGECDSGFIGLWISEYRRYARPGVEIHNPTVNAIDMTGYRLDVVGPTNLAYTFPAFTLEPGAFVFVHMGNGIDDETALFAGPSAAFGPDVAVSLYDDGFTPLDFLRLGASATPPPSGTAWFGANAPAPEMDANESIKRNLETFDTDGAADWIIESPSTPGFNCNPGLSLCSGACIDLAENPLHCGDCGAPCGANETCSSGVCSTVDAIVISEIKNAGNETIELFNGASVAVDISGWQIDWVADSAGPGSFTVPAGQVVDPGGFVVFHETTGTNNATNVFMAQTITWNTAIAVSLVDDASNGIDFVRTGDSVTMPPAGTGWSGGNATNPANTGSETLRRQVFAPDTNAAADWSLATNTPASHCAVGETVCGGDCFDLDADAAACGACGNTCGNGGICFNGKCLEHGALRFVGAGLNGTSEGRLDLFQTSGWRRVTDFGIDSTDADVACRQLGFTSGSDTGSLSSSPCVNCIGRVYGFTCTGTEVRLDDCPHSGDSSSSNGARVVCTP
jgi:hypothetical protein